MISFVRAKGFTLIELLVVMVIVAATTTLLAQGLASTWQNFSRLSARDLTNNQASLPFSWFRQSVAGALLSHPERVAASGDSTYFEFTTFAVPTDQQQRPALVRWRIENIDNQWLLIFDALQGNHSTNLYTSSIPMTFEYWLAGNWSNEPPAEPGLLPRAVRIVNAEGVTLVTAVVARPVTADIPPELPLFGVYDFGA